MLIRLTEQQQHVLDSAAIGGTYSGHLPALVTLTVWLVVGMFYLWQIRRFSARTYLCRTRNFLHLSHALIGLQVIGMFSGTWQLSADGAVAQAISCVGLLLGVSGLALYLWAKITLGPLWDRHASIQVNHQLIRRGPYAWCRNPIFLGQFGLFLGAGMASLNGLALICCAPALWSFYRRLRTEEKLLAEYFGSDYYIYQSETPCFWPIPKHFFIRRSACL